MWDIFTASFVFNFWLSTFLCITLFKLFPLKKTNLKYTLRKSIFDTSIENYLDNIETCLAASFYELTNDGKQTWEQLVLLFLPSRYVSVSEQLLRLSRKANHLHGRSCHKIVYLNLYRKNFKEAAVILKSLACMVGRSENVICTIR